MKYYFLILALLLLPLTACGGMPTAASAPSPTLITATQPPPSETPTPASTETQPAPTVEAKSYLSQLDIVFESPEQLLKYNGAKIGGQTSVDKSAGLLRLGEVTIKQETLAKLSMRALHNMLFPEEEDTDATLKDFASRLAEIQAGSRDCAELMRTVTMYDANGSGEPTEMVIVPSCGASPVPTGATEVKNVDFTIGYGAVWSESEQKYLTKPEMPWFELTTITDLGSGLMFDAETGTVHIFVGLSSSIASEKIKSGISSGFETTLYWLQKHILGKRLRLSNTEKFYDNGLTWDDDIQVK